MYVLHSIFAYMLFNIVTDAFCLHVKVDNERYLYRKSYRASSRENVLQKFRRFQHPMLLAFFFD